MNQKTKKSGVKILRAGMAALLAFSAVTASADKYGYCTDVAERGNIFRMGAGEKQGLAIRLGAEKLALLKGGKITGISALFGSSRTDGGTADIFISRTPGGEPLAKGTVALKSAVKWIDLSFDTPYTITGEEEELYIGYTASISTKTNMLMSDFTADMQDCSFVYNDGEWIDTYGLGFGNASIRAIVEGENAFTDLMVKPVETAGYYKAGNAYTFEAELFNFGSNQVQSFDVCVTVGDSAPQTFSYDNLSLAKNAVYAFKLPEINSVADGMMPVVIEVAKVNGAIDAAPADNKRDNNVFFYPEGMERSILLEGFTGQDCHNCPSGHSILNAFLESVETSGSTPVIEVMHHAGYKPDFMTMDSDLDYTYFYGGTNTFAPAVMLNRSVVPAVGTVPVVNLSTANLVTAYNTVEATQPYASLGLESTFNPETREVTVKLNTLTHNDLPSVGNVVNVMLVQDGILAAQKPYGDNYVHNAVFRGVLTGNSWGLLLDEASCVAGGKSEWTKTFTLPEMIFSDYWAYLGLTDEQKVAFSFAAAPENMRIVAYIGAFENGNISGHTVYNAVNVPLGQSYVQGGITAIDDIRADGADVRVRVAGGRIIVDGNYDTLTVYTIDGRAVNADAVLGHGVYVARVAAGNCVVVKKIKI